MFTKLEFFKKLPTFVKVFFIGFILFVISFVLPVSNKTYVCTKDVEAVCVTKAAVETKDDDGYVSIHHVPIFLYEYDGNGYESSSSFYSFDHDHIYQVGKTYTIQINPNNPTEIMVAGESSVAIGVSTVFRVFGLIFLGFAAFGFVKWMCSDKAVDNEGFDV